MVKGYSNQVLRGLGLEPTGVYSLWKRDNDWFLFVHVGGQWSLLKRYTPTEPMTTLQLVEKLYEAFGCDEPKKH